MFKTYRAKTPPPLGRTLELERHIPRSNDANVSSKSLWQLAFIALVGSTCVAGTKCALADLVLRVCRGSVVELLMDSFEFQGLGVKAKAQGKVGCIGAYFVMVVILGIAIWSAVTMGKTHLWTDPTPKEVPARQ